MMQPLSPHDLIHVHAEPAWFSFEHDADEAFAHLHACPLVVVRRGRMREGLVPIGVRGTSRSQRYAGWMHPQAIARVVQPSTLLSYDRDLSKPPFKALDELVLRWRDLHLPWGPTGSAGFELASGVASVSPSSDLDIQIRAARPFHRDQARHLLEAASNRHTAVDILVETPFGGFALAEYAAHATCLLRTHDGPVLMTDPWRTIEAAA